MREKGGDSDWYGYCVDDPVNRVDVWGLEGEETSPSKPYYCWWTKCDDKGTMQGDYQPIEGREGVLPFLLQFGPMKPIVWPFQAYYEKNKEKE